MGTYRVYHATRPTWGMDNPMTWPADGYRMVAEVECDDVEAAHYYTNHIERPWWDHANVTRHGPETRSTSCGDVVVDPSGTAWVCATCGWEHVPAFA